MNLGCEDEHPQRGAEAVPFRPRQEPHVQLKIRVNSNNKKGLEVNLDDKKGLDHNLDGKKGLEPESITMMKMGFR